MKIITVCFARKFYYNKLLRVFENSLKAVMPKIKPKILRPKLPRSIDHKRDTAFAFIAAAKYVLKAKHLTAVCDCDLMFLKSIADITEKDFDIAVTTRSKVKYNTGLWFYRPSNNAALFVREWIEQTNNIMKDFCTWEDFCWNHGGIDQASLYLTIRKLKRKIKILELPCEEWNSTQSEWRYIDENTRIIHIKSQLRGFCCKPNKNKITEKWEFLRPYVKMWKGFL